MKRTELKRAAACIVSLNVTPRVTRVEVHWDETVAHIIVSYFVDDAATEEELELCELTLAELLAEFPDIRTANTTCVATSYDDRAADERVVYERDRQLER